MGGAILGLLALVLVLGAGVLVAATIRITGGVAMLLAAYAIGFAEIVGLTFLLSASSSLTRPGLLGGAAALFVIAGAIWFFAGARRPRFDVSGLVALPKPCLVLGAVVAIGLAYVLALVVATPPNGWDPLNYHLARAAFWLQAKHLGYIEPTYDERLNLNPPNGEIGSAFALGVTHNEVFVGFVQFFAALACGLAVYGLARRLGSTIAESAFAGLLFLSLPIVLLQASLAKNDLVVASLLLAAAYFVVGNGRAHAALAAVATALAVGTKTTALYALVVLGVVALVAEPHAGRARRLCAVAAGAVLGSYWYVVNLVETGHFFGDQSAQQGITATLHGAANVVTAYGTIVDAFDLSGARGRDILLYLAAALIAVVATRAHQHPRRALAIVALASAPLVMLVLSEHVGRPTLVDLYRKVGEPRGYVAVGATTASPTIASDTASWFGPVGLLLGLGTAWVVSQRTTAISRVGRVFGLAPLLWGALVSLTLSYNPFLGRFFVFPIALSAALWGRALRRPAAATGLVALATVTLTLCLVHYAEKPSGVRLLDRTNTASVWRMPRWEVQSQHDPALAPVLAFLDERVEPRTSVALALGDNGFGYPAFGPHLERRVEIVPAGSGGRDAHGAWLYASARRTAEIDSTCWQPQLQSSEGSVFQRSDSCPSSVRP